MFRVIIPFADMMDNNRPYKAGETFPREGLTVSASRIAELTGSGNRVGRPLIESVKIEVETEKPARKRVRKDGTQDGR